MALTFRLHIHTRGRAFTVNHRVELAACLRRIADILDRNRETINGANGAYHPNRILDSTGEDCGRWFIHKENE